VPPAIGIDDDDAAASPPELRSKTHAGSRPSHPVAPPPAPESVLEPGLEPTPEPAPEPQNGAGINHDGEYTYNCPKCATRLTAPAEEYLTAARQEHEDYHFALELHEAEGGVSDSGSGSAGPLRSGSASASASASARTSASASRGATTRGGGAIRGSKKAVGIKAFFAPK
jgi:hypothetical protein